MSLRCLAVLVIASIGCSQTLTAPQATKESAALVVDAGGVASHDGGDVQNGPIEILRVRVQGGGSPLGFYAVAGQTYSISPNVPVELWIEWTSPNPPAQPPRLVVDWGDGTVDNIHCGPCKLTRTYRPGRYSITVKMDDRLGGVTTRMFSMDSRLPTDSGPGGVFTFANPAPITIPYNESCAELAALTFPSSISAAAVTGRVSRVTVTFHGLSTLNNNMLALLVAPNGQTVKLLDEAGSGSVTDSDITFDDGYGAFGATLGPGSYTFRPSMSSNDSPLLPPAPNVVDGKRMDALKETTANGEWRLFLQSHLMCANGNAELARGWSLTITTVSS